ncbi:DUF192 domain-containing protein [Streptomyces europaeiscabiei]|uniref:DUF192 domain-containing protein n=1 Tax=Streptomyces europaeiscabiei TaxID=146819 RepID=UPI0029A404A5|nr:DUF192 domain-containing protein [Streptomyces europaeiscabiei]MDX2763956.1 DUF192 domain-containing protein [Streptomyces europaeiscabiei]
MVQLEIATVRAARTRGLLGRDGINGALLFTATRSVHTIGMRFTIDIAYLDDDLRVTDQHTLPPNRIAAPRWRARHVLEAAAGALAHWGIQPGCQLTVGP